MKLIFLLLILFTFARLPGQDFKEVSQQAGLDHLFNVGDVIYGGGVAIFDYNNDGWEDMYITGGLNADKLYRNNKDKTFTEVLTASGLELVHQFHTQGAIAGDIDNDGDRDLFITTRCKVADLKTYTHNLLFLNRGDGTFIDVTETWGINLDIGFSSAASFADVNLDGYLDLFVGNYIADPFYEVFHADGTNEPSMNGSTDVLYINQGGTGFINMTVSYNINVPGCALAAAFTDFDNDHDLDLYVANDFGNAGMPPNSLYRNNYPEASFTEAGFDTGTDIALNAMGIAIGDLENDGDLDYFVSNMGPDVLLKNNGQGLYEDATVPANLVKISVPWQDRGYLAVSWGTVFFDYNLDGYQDLFVANGDLSPPALPNTNVLYQNQRDGTFKDVTLENGLNDPHVARGTAVFDYDKDGDLDLVVVNQQYPQGYGQVEHPRLCLYENLTADGSWLKVKLEGTFSNRDGLGARVVVHQAGQRFIREIDGGSSHNSHNSTIAHFGLPKNSSVNLLEVYWPGGKRNVMENISPNKQVLFKETEDQPVVTNIFENDLYSPHLKVFPNPAQSQQIQVEFHLKTPAPVNLSLFDMYGKKITEFVDSKEAYGHFSEMFHLNHQPGIYILKLKSSHYSIDQKIWVK
ncbi:MAG: FG-GAP-like repeat-containing protein [Candidatus Cyclobacteriaceae bacterium M3_2C_046]